MRWARVDEVDASAVALSPTERDRLDALRSPAERRRFAGARLLLRQVVADAVGCSPGEVELHQHCPRCDGHHGRPSVLVPTGTGPQVSMAHAGDLAVVAVGDAELGIDLEPIDGLGSDRDAHALRTWVRTEAVLKATGHGLDVDPRLVDVGSPTGPPALRRWDGPGRRPVLRLADLDTEPGHLAALARRGRRPLLVDARRVDLTDPTDRTSPTGPTGFTAPR